MSKMAKYKIIAQSIGNLPIINPFKMILIDSLIDMGGNLSIYKSLQKYIEEQKCKLFFIQYAHIISVNYSRVPDQWVARRNDCADVVVVRGDVTLDDFEIEKTYD